MESSGTRQLVSLTQHVFDLSHLCSSIKPVSFGEERFSAPDKARLLHFMVKRSGSDDVIVPPGFDPDLLLFIHFCLETARDAGLPLKDRHAYLTVDTKPFKAGSCQRTPGWHLDGLQGDEVPTKQNACYNFIWSNHLGTEWAKQGFDINGLDVSRHNVYKWLGSQVRDENIRRMQPGTLYLLPPYTLHRGRLAEEDCDNRLFLRLHLSRLPITSVKMTLNPAIDYPYAVHTTSGEIPEHLRSMKG